MSDLHQLLASERSVLPERVYRTVVALGEEVCALETRIDTMEAELERVALEEPVIHALLKIPGIGLLTATALFATVADILAFKSGGQLACWLGLTPREVSSGGRGRLGGISKQGDPYVRMLLIHGARSALSAAQRRAAAHLLLTQLQAWAVKRAREGHSTKAAVGYANKLARIAWAVWHHDPVRRQPRSPSRMGGCTNETATTRSEGGPSHRHSARRVRIHGRAVGPPPE
jgi:transposase